MSSSEGTTALQILCCGAAEAGATGLARRITASAPFASVIDLGIEVDQAGVLTGAGLRSHAAIIVVDAVTGLALATRQCALVLSRLRIPEVAFAITKTDDVGASRETYASLARQCEDLWQRAGGGEVTCIPVAGQQEAEGAGRSSLDQWDSGPTVSEWLKSVATRAAARRQLESASSDPGAQEADRFEATVIWTAERPMLQGRSYAMVAGESRLAATVAPLKYRIDPETLKHTPAKVLNRGDVGVCGLEMERPITFRPFAEQRHSGAVVLVDPKTGAALGLGLLHFALRRSQNVQWQTLNVTKTSRAALTSQTPCALWFTGLSGAGKSTIANLVEMQLHAQGHHTYLLDGDNVRHGLNKDLGFTDVDRVENIRRVAEVARLMVDAGLIVLVSFISPFGTERRMARELFASGEFIEVFVDVPIHVAEARDPKGLYRKARKGQLKNFTGIDSPYETPERPEIRLDTTQMTPETSAAAVLEYLIAARIIGAR